MSIAKILIGVTTVGITSLGGTYLAKRIINTDEAAPKSITSEETPERGDPSPQVASQEEQTSTPPGVAQ